MGERLKTWVPVLLYGNLTYFMALMSTSEEREANGPIDGQKYYQGLYPSENVTCHKSEV